MMKRIVLLVTVALVMALMLALAAPAFATIHPLSCSERSQAPEGTAAETQDPPGLTGGSNADNVAQPIDSVSKNDTAAGHAFKPDECPAHRTSS